MQRSIPDLPTFAVSGLGVEVVHANKTKQHKTTPSAQPRTHILPLSLSPSLLFLFLFFYTLRASSLSVSLSTCVSVL